MNNNSIKTGSLNPNILNPDSLNRKGILLMIASSVLFASGGLVLKWIDWNPLAINGARSGFGMLTIGMYLLLVRHKPKINSTILLGAISYMLMTTMFVTANKMTSAANAIVLQYSCPIWILGLDWVLKKKKPARSSLITLGIVVLGIFCFFCSSLRSGNVLGDIVALISGFFYAVLFMINSMKGGDAISSVFFGMLFSFICLGPFSLQQNWTGQSILVLLWLGIFQVGLAYICFSRATSLISPLQASLVNGIEPVLNPLLVAIFWHESLSWLQLVGAAIVIGAITLDSIRQSRA